MSTFSLAPHLHLKGGTFRDLPVNDATHVNLQMAVVSQQPLLHFDQVNSLVIQSQETHTSLKCVEGVLALLSALPSGTT